MLLHCFISFCKQKLSNQQRFGLSEQRTNTQKKNAKHSHVNRNFYTIFFFKFWLLGVEDTIVVQRVFLAATGKRFSGQRGNHDEELTSGEIGLLLLSCF